MNNNDKYLTIGDFTKLVKYNLEDLFTQVYLKGEISNFRPSTSGHWYFSLKDNNATIKAIIFKNNQKEIMDVLKSARLKILENGQEVLVEGRISVYEKSGEYSIVISKIIPVGIGELTVKFELLKEKLSKEGLFDESKKKSLPKYPQSIGIVTSPTGAALQDMLNVLKRRFCSLKIVVFPASVQGNDAKYEVVKAIKCANYHYVKNTDKKVDVLIIARGGGSIEDLWAFNEEIVAYEIHKSPIPTITGIGHEIDFTIADFCSDVRAPTPSAAAELVVKNREDLINSIYSYKLRIEGSFGNALEKLIYRFENCNPKRLSFLFEKTYQNKVQEFSYCYEKQKSFFENYYTNLRQSFSFLLNKLDNLSPLSILKRGYSLVLDKNSNLVKSFKQVKTNDEISVILSEGQITASVKETKEKSEYF
ncbi:MAG: exodeoxyribonuclease VII large subunit [Spirochaetes bacterium GWD1_27_9]|nr:MAG: exodeoxyribonuclease VII large subunit [Spirochaetes bacterium GWB1_27_13]OHD42262.1 MAG: exodeoxyribonuclease VII large subunit [Spirochaetes bacterium GWD1_27_9]